MRGDCHSVACSSTIERVRERESAREKRGEEKRESCIARVRENLDRERAREREKKKKKKKEEREREQRGGKERETRERKSV